MPDYSKQISTLDGWLNQNKDKQDTPEFQAVVTDLKKLVDSQGVSPSQPEPPVEPAKEDKGFIEKTSESLERRGKMGFEIVSAQKQGEQTWGETAVQLVGKVGIGFASDLVFNGVVEGTQALTPDVFEDPIKNAATYASAKILDNPVGKKGLEALYEGAEAYGEWKENNPRMARNLEGVINIGLVWTPAKGNPNQIGAGLKNLPTRARARTASLADNLQTGAANVSQKGPLRSAANKLDVSATNQAAVQRHSRILEAITPDESLKNNMELIRQGQLSPGGTFKSREFLPSSSQSQAVNDILALSNGKPGDGMLSILNQSEQAITRLQSQMRKHLSGGKKQIYDTDSVLTRIGSLQEKLLKDNKIAIGSEQAKDVSSLFDNIIDEIAKKPRTAKGLLQARIGHDKFANTFKTKGVLYESDQAAAISRSHNAIRREINDIVAEMVPQSSGILKRQSGIFKVQDTIIRNAALEPNKWIGQQLAKLNGFLGTRSLTTNVIAGLIGVGGLGAAALGGPLWTFGIAAPYLAYKGGKFALSPVAKTAYSDLLKGTDTAIKMTLSGTSELGKYGTAQTVDLLKSLKADRAALIQLLEEGQ